MNGATMSSTRKTIEQLEVPVVVRLGERAISVREVLDFFPGAIIELPKPADTELDLLINNKQIGKGRAVKVGENFGIRLTYVGGEEERLKAITPIEEYDEY
ncbi:MAG: FliM/FliN family flagellar motor C-terminal domain-containing protein [Phycisphaerales bacterium]